MNVLVINCGSSSLKYQLINADTEEEGEYHGRRAIMSLEVGKKALDFPSV